MCLCIAAFHNESIINVFEFVAVCLNYVCAALIYFIKGSLVTLVMYKDFNSFAQQIKKPSTLYTLLMSPT